MRIHGRTALHEFLDDLVVFRNLVPLDERLPSLHDLRERLDLPEGVTPRKSQPAYAEVIVHMLETARAIDLPGTGPQIERLIYFGDTRLNDGTAFVNIARAGNWAGLAFIASEKNEPAPAEISEQGDGTLYLANHWGDIQAFEKFRRQRDFPIDEQTVVVLDIDKTALGARGRNDQVINQARVQAARRTVEDLLGTDFEQVSFQTTYDELDQARYHSFTTDNQDYLAYICLIVDSGLYRLDSLVERLRAGSLTSFEQFIAEVDGRANELPDALRQMHCQVYECMQSGDPTPFKAFRYNEYYATIERMGCLGDDASVDAMLAHEIVVTQEVREAALRWRAQGALLFGLSDKPDEASIPGQDAMREGMQPIHRAETHAVG